MSVEKMLNKNIDTSILKNVIHDNKWCLFKTTQKVSIELMYKRCMMRE